MDAKSCKRNRGFTRTKITKVLQKAQTLIDDKLNDEIPATIRCLESTAQTLAAQDREMLDLIDDEDAEEDIEEALQYELKIENMLSSLSKCLSLDLPVEKETPELIDILQRQNEMSIALMRNQEISTLPKRDLQVFDGRDITKFKPFMNSFQRSIEEKTSSCSDRLYYLEQYTTGLPNELVRSCCHMDPAQGYATAKKCLNDKYGNEFDIANAFLDKIEAWPTIKSEDGPALEKFSVFLQSCLNYTEHVSALVQLNSPKEMQLILQKLPYKQREKWRTYVLSLLEKHKDVTFSELVNFTIRESKLLNLPVFGAIKGPQVKPLLKHDSDQHRKSPARTATAMATETIKRDKSGARNLSCPCCDRRNHSLDDCSAFKGKSYEERREFILVNRLCFGCLQRGHLSKECINRMTCEICNRKHPTSIHAEDKGMNKQPSKVTVSPVETKNCITGAGASGKIAFALIPVKIKLKSQTDFVMTYAGLDNFSSDCFISNKLVKELDASGPEIEIMLTTMGSKRAPTRTHVISDLEIYDLDENERVSLPPTYSREVLPIGNEELICEEDIEGWPNIRDLPFNFVEADVGLILGINAPEAIKCFEIVNSVENGPYATRHKLGWAVNGPLSARQHFETHMHRIKVEKLADIESKLQNMYSHDFPDSNLDELGPSVEDIMWKKRIEGSVTLQENHYKMRLPFREDDPSFPDNREQAYQRVIGMKRKLKSRPEFHKEYSHFVDGMIEKGYAERIPDNELRTEPGKSWYLIHHGVRHKEKGKLRVVFNCSLKYHGVSLNDQLLQGPDLANGLFGVLLRFRQGSVAVTGDIEKMFYQVGVPQEHADFLRFLWFPNGDVNAEPIDYRLKVHVFGAVSSPSCANYALRKTAMDNESDFSKAATETVIKDFYVDDMVKSMDDALHASCLVREVRQLCLKGGFHLTKFVSNCESVMESIPTELWAEGMQEIDLSCDETSIHRTLGVKWNVQQDTLSVKVNLSEAPSTRRGILSTIFSIYDPFGLICPAILPAKRIFQVLCQDKRAWDEPLPLDQGTLWKKWMNDLSLLTACSVPRCFRPHPSFASSCEMHIFCDGSEVGYGAVAYLRFEDKSGQAHCVLVMAKSRLAPLKKMTIPRLELTAAKLAVTLKVILDRELELNITKTIIWTDSTVVLKYLRNTTKRFQRFVANRISFIQDRTTVGQWRYVTSEENPADHASRGVSIAKFLDLQDWFNGPKFLWQTESSWPKQENLPDDTCVEDLEICKEKRVLSTNTRPEVIESIVQASSSWIRLKRMIAWLVKIKNRLLSREVNFEISIDDLKESESIIILSVQKQNFAEERERLLKGLAVSKQSPLRKLNPFIDERGLIRVGGRLRNAIIDESKRFPVILPKDHQVSNLIILFLHKNLGHLGRGSTMSTIREHGFWIIRANSAVRRVLRQCVLCRKLEGRTGEQLMADLPADRLSGDHAPFSNVGVDFFGPFHVVRGRATEKRYGVVFTCVESRAIHLEVANSLDTSSFINVLRRFIARRGRPRLMRSDNGTNLVGGNAELKRSIKEWNQSQIIQTMQQHDIEWIFHPPSASHFGGIWEREIRTVRKVLQALLQEQRIRLTDDNLNTLMCEVESILNQRPLTLISDDPQDLNTLTPNHLLLLRPENSFPPGIFSASDSYSKRRWRQIQYLADLFWTRWKKEYVSLLQSRQKWTKPSRNFSVGDVVLVSQSPTPRNQWPLGRIISVKPDDDGRVRIAHVKTSDSQLVRPITKLVLLVPCQQQDC